QQYLSPGKIGRRDGRRDSVVAPAEGGNPGWTDGWRQADRDHLHPAPEYLRGRGAGRQRVCHARGRRKEGLAALQRRLFLLQEGAVIPRPIQSLRKEGGASMEREVSTKERPGKQMKAAFRWLSIALAAVTLAWPAIVFAAPVVFEAAGSTPADIQAA